MTKKTRPSSQQPRQRGYQLLATPLPLAEESFASWIQRIAGDHQYSMKRLVEIVGYQPERRDWDLPIPAEDCRGILAMAGISRSQRRDSLFALAVLGKQVEPSRFLLDDAGRPRYRWCAACLASDAVPYLRWHWRLAVVRECWRHRTALEEVCSWCASPVLLHRARLVQIGSGGMANTLAQCDRCGLPLVSLQIHGARYNRTLQHKFRKCASAAVTESGRATVDQIFASILTFVSLAKLHSAWIVRGDDRACEPPTMTLARSRAAQCLARLRVARTGQLERWTLNAETFANPEAADSAAGKPYIHWSWRLGHTGRTQVAKALRLIRTEQRSDLAQKATR